MDVFQKRPSFITINKSPCTSFPLNGQDPLGWPEIFCQRPLLPTSLASQKDFVNVQKDFVNVLLSITLLSVR